MLALLHAVCLKVRDFFFGTLKYAQMDLLQSGESTNFNDKEVRRINMQL